MEQAVESISDRIQECLHARLLECLPISMSAYVALPVVLQTVNVACVRGHDEEEHAHTRKLAILKRVLETQRANFDGTSFIIGTLEQLSATARGEAYMKNQSTSREEKAQRRSGWLKSYWPNLVRSHPKVMIHLLYRLDRALCSTTNEKLDDIYPDELLEERGGGS